WKSVPEVRELQGDPEILFFERRDDRLEVVTLLARDPELITLRLRGHALGPLVLDELVDLLGVVGGEPGVDGDLLPHRSLGGLLDLPRLQGLQRYLAADKLLFENLMKGAQAVLGRRTKHHLGGAP